MKTSIATVLLFAVLSAGCRSSTGPVRGEVSGTVRHLDGGAAAFATVWTSQGRATQADSRGRYTIATYADFDSITVLAREKVPADEPRIGDWFGRIRVAPAKAWPGGSRRSPPSARGTGEADIVLDEFMPI